MIIGLFDCADRFIDDKKTSYGGSQTWLLEISKEFSNMNHEVFVFCNTQFHKTNNITFIPKNKFEEVCKNIEYDRFIYSRGLYKLNQVKSKHKSMILHDMDVLKTDSKDFTNLDNIWFLSKYAQDHFTSIYGTKYINKYKLTFNAIDQKLYNPETKKENMMVWSSCLERGFYFFITKVYPSIKKEIPDFHINICQYNTVQIKEIPGVKYLGNLDKIKLSALQNKAKLWCYPNLGYRGFGSTKIPFNETFCITAIENACAGANIVCGANGGLLTTLPEEFLLGKEFFKNNRITDEEKYALLLANKCIEILKDKIEIKCDVSKYTWENAAKSLLG